MLVVDVVQKICLSSSSSLFLTNLRKASCQSCITDVTAEIASAESLVRLLFELAIGSIVFLVEVRGECTFRDPNRNENMFGVIKIDVMKMLYTYS